MEWSKPKVSGEFMADRTRHTAVAVCSDEDLPNRGENGVISLTLKFLIAGVPVFLDACWMSRPGELVYRVRGTSPEPPP